MKRAFFVVTVLVLATVASFLSAGDAILPFVPFASFGYDASPDGRITDVVAGMPADRAGIRAGDRIDVSQVPFHDRRFIGQLSVAPSGETLTYHVVRGNTIRIVTLTAVRRPRTLVDNLTDELLIAFGLAFIAIATVLLLMRPSILTWSFLWLSFGAANSITYEQTGSDALLFLIHTVEDIAIVASAAATFAFSLLFPQTTASPRKRRVLWALVLATAAVIAIDVITGFAATTNARILVPEFPNDAITNDFSVVCYVAGVIAFIINYVRSDQAMRKRMQWVALGFALGFGLNEVLNVLQGFVSITPPIWLLNSLQCFDILVPLAVAYAILKHRVIDVRFFVSRALVYGAITTVAVVFLALLEFVIARSIEARNLGTLVEIAGAVAIGLGINRIHTSIDRNIDRFVFRSVHLAEQHLQRIGHALMFAQSSGAVDRLVVEEAARALDLDRVTVVHDFDADDPLAMQLHAQRDPIERDDRLYVPMIVRHQLLGYIVFEHHRSGAAIDPNERSILVRLSHQAAIAYDHIQSEQRTAENERLRGDLMVERAKNAQLAELLTGAAAVKGPPASA